MRTLAAIAAFAGLSYASAECANACSGKGECGNKDQCICYDNYFGADCSLQRCPSALAFVDVPNGDLNHDGSLGKAAAASGYSKVQWSKFPQAEYWPTQLGTVADDAADANVAAAYKKGITGITNGGGYVAAKGEAHWFTECSGKGVCDRSTGECACFDGYTGSACQRTTCPNDCSGHGRCKQVADIAAGALNKKFVDSAAGVNTYSGVSQAFEYRLFDADKNSACVCDLGYGGVDCSLRECPRGDDPLTAVAATCNGAACNNEVQGFTLSTSTPANSAYRVNFADVDGNVWKSPAFSVDFTSVSATSLAAQAAKVKSAIEHLPNSLVGNVTVTATNPSTGHARFLVSFVSMPGNINEFSVVRDSAGAMDPLVQPYEPVQVIDTAGVTGNFNVFVNPDDVTNYRDTQLKGNAATLANAFKASTAVAYELGSTNPVDVVQIGTSTKYQLIFKNNVNRPGAAKKFGKNPVRITGATAGSATAVPDSWDGNTEYSVCSNRGVCDYSSGLCACFAGYVGNACESQSALAM